MIDNEKNIGLEQKTNQVKELLNVINCEPTRFWYRDEGGKNIVRWLNDALHVSEKVSDFLSMYSFCSVKVALDWRTFQVLCKQKKLI